VSSLPAPLARAYAACEQLARSHYENFPVASHLLPAATRPHVAALYAFARVADDIADEGVASSGERRARLRAWQERLHATAHGQTDPSRTVDREGLILMAVGHSIRSLDLPLALFDDLVSAFGQDTMTTRYTSWCDVLDYCRRSANPIGRLFLRIAGYRDGSLDRSADALCTALQLTNFWQDFGRDWRAGRLYVPREVQAACGADEEDLASGRIGSAWACAIEACVAFTHRQFDEGRAVCDGVNGLLKLELRFTWLGGVRVLERTERNRRQLFERRPALGIADGPLLVSRAICWGIGRTRARR
jgi:hydroxysqualene synthase